MSENPISNVNRVDMASVQAAQSAVQTQQVAQANPQVVTEIKEKEKIPSRQAEAAAKEAPTEAVQKPVEEEKPQQPSSLINRQTNLKFQVDDKTHEVTIMIMDRATNKVITTIPPEKLKDVPPGDLLQYLI